MPRGTNPAPPTQPSAHQASTPTMPKRPCRIARRLRLIAAPDRAIAWKLVKLSSEEFVKGLANKAGGITTLVLGALLVAWVLGLDPVDVVRHVLGM